MRAPIPLLSFAASLLLLSSAASADRASAEALVGTGEKALQEKAWARAEENYRKALVEDPTLLPAHFGLAQALLWEGRGDAAGEELKRFVAGLKADATAPAAWKTLGTKAEKQLQDIDVATADLRKVLDSWADELLALARKCLTKDAATARRAARKVLEFRPDDKGALEVIQKLGEAGKGAPVALFNGLDLKNWVKVDPKYFAAENGFLVSDVPKGSLTIYADLPVEGEFDIRMEARVMEEHQGDPLVSILLYGKDEYDYVSVGSINQKAYFVDRTAEDTKRIIFKKQARELKFKFDPIQWTTYELRFRNDSVTALVNGEILASDPRTDRRKGGFVGVYVQNAKVSVRSVEFQPR